jgi:hypothetical protein
MSNRPTRTLRQALWLGLVAVLLLAAPVAARADYDSDPFNPTVARDCWLLIAKAEREYNIPAGLLHAISLVETGKGIRGWVLPWPYTVGVNGSGSLSYTSREAALAGFQRLRNLGFVRFNLRAPGVSRSKATPLEVAAALGSLPATTYVTLEGINYGRRFNSEAETEAFINRMFAQGYRNLDVGMMQINWRIHGSHFSSVKQALNPTANLRYAVNYLLEHRQTRDWWGSVGRYHSGTSYYANRYIRNVYAMYLRIHRVNT